MRSLRPSLTIALFAGSVAAIACGGGDDDDDTMNTGNPVTSMTDAAVLAPSTPGATPGGTGTLDAGASTGGSNPFGQFDASGIIGAALDSGLINAGGTPAGAINTSAVCSMFPQVCVDGSISLGGFTAGGGGRTAGGGFIAGGGFTAGSGGFTAGSGGFTAGSGGFTAGGFTAGGFTAGAGGFTAGRGFTGGGGSTAGTNP